MSLAAWQTLAGSQGTVTLSMAPSAMAAPQSFLRALLFIPTLVSEKCCWDVAQPPARSIAGKQADGLGASSWEFG